MKKTVIIGGGAAGMMAAATICEQTKDAQVVLIEKNSKLGRKVALTGGGRCNVTTGLTDIKEVLRKYPRGSRFLRHAMYEFPPRKMQEWVEQHGVPLKTETDMRVFPRSDRGDDIVEIFKKILRKSNAEIKLKKMVTKIEKREDKFIVGGEETDSLIITTGGAGHDLVGSLGHKITDLASSLSPFVTEEEWTKELSGLSFQKARLRIGKYEFVGPILLTHKGISGPATFAISALTAYEHLPMTLNIDFISETSREELTAAITAVQQRSFCNTIGQFVPKAFAKMIATDKKNAEVSKKEINKAIETIKNTELTITSHVEGKEFVTAGGIDLADINPKTMESKICSGLYFAGEILDVDGYTGGFNLQAAWATGRLAGKHAGINLSVLHNR